MFSQFVFPGSTKRNTLHTTRCTLEVGWKCSRMARRASSPNLFPRHHGDLSHGASLSRFDEWMKRALKIIRIAKECESQTCTGAFQCKEVCHSRRIYSASLDRPYLNVASETHRRRRPPDINVKQTFRIKWNDYRWTRQAQKGFDSVINPWFLWNHLAPLRLQPERKSSFDFMGRTAGQLIISVSTSYQAVFLRGKRPLFPSGASAFLSRLPYSTL